MSDFYSTATSSGNTNTASSLNMDSFLAAARKLDPIKRFFEYEAAKCILQGVDRPTVRMHPEDIARLKAKSVTENPYQIAGGVEIVPDPTVTIGTVKCAGVVTKDESRKLAAHEQRLKAEQS